VYWWEDVGDEIQQSDVEAHLKKKYGYGVKHHYALSHRATGFNSLAYEKRYKDAHGYDEGVMTLKEMMTEGVMEKAAEDFIKQTIQGTEWQGKVFLIEGTDRQRSKYLKLLVTKPDGNKFSEWITKKVGVYKEGSNPIISQHFKETKFNFNGIVYNGLDLSGIEINQI
jgi:hypothetical protein